MIGSFFAGIFFETHLAEYHPAFWSKLDVDHMVKQVKESGAEVCMFTPKDSYGWSYYDTKIGRKYPAMGNRDLLKELAEKLHEENIKVYTWFVCLADKRLWNLHPDWRQRRPDGTPMDVGARLRRGVTPGMKLRNERVCPNSPAGDFLLEQIKEVAHYDIDGLVLDAPFFGSCYCDYCKQKFREEFGVEMPESPDCDPSLWNSLLRWRRKECKQWHKRVFDAVRSIKPNVAIGKKMGGLSSSKGSSVENFGVADFTIADIYRNKGDLGFVYVLKLMKSLEKGNFFMPVCYRQKSVAPRPFMFYNAWKPGEQWLWEALTAVADGGGVMCADYMHLDGVFYDRSAHDIGAVLREVRRREEWLRNGQTIKFAALYFSQNSKDLYGEREHLDHFIPTGSMGRNLYTTSFMGAFKALLDGHIPFEVVHSRCLDEVPKYKVLMIPNMACIGSEEVEAIAMYVKNGGGLVATYDTSLYDENAQIQANFLLSDVLGVDYTDRTGFWQDYIEITAEHPVTQGVERDYVLQHVGSHITVRVHRDASVLGRIVTPYRRDEVHRYVSFVQQPYRKTDFPSIVVNEYGSGRVVYFPGRIDATYIEEGLPELLPLMTNAIQWAAKEETPVTVEAPPNINITLHQQASKGRTILHLLNRQPLVETIPVRNIKVKIRLTSEAPVSTVYVAPERLDLRYKVEEGYVKVTVPEVKIHEMVVVEQT